MLGGFDVSPASGSEDPLDLGAILPGAAADGRSIELALQPGQVVTYRLVMTVPAIYQFELDSNESALSAQLTAAARLIPSIQGARMTPSWCPVNTRSESRTSGLGKLTRNCTSEPRSLIPSFFWPAVSARARDCRYG